MNIFLAAHKTIMQQLIDKKVDFMLIGGYAVNYHGYNRNTGDMDIWIKADNTNKILLLDAMAALDFDEEGIETIRTWNFEKPRFFSIFEQPFQTEFMTHISGVKYNDAKQVAVDGNIDGLTFKIINIDNLISNKKASGRTKDLADVEHLEKILYLKSKRS